MAKDSFLERRSVVATFGILALIAGGLFVATNMPNSQPTGNFVQNNIVQSFNLVSLIGILLIACSAILIVYAIVKKD